MDFSNIDIKELACFVYEALKDAGIDAVLVGGACVSIYTKNRYQSYDLDFVSYEELRHIEKALERFGFKRTGRCFAHENCLFVIDFVNPPVAIGQESVRHFDLLKTAVGSLQLLSPTDCVKDRLASFFHWNDEQALEQAIMVAQGCATVDLSIISHWAKREGYQEKLQHFLKKLQ
ncbi:MAG: hypothetical protein JSR46_08580 [Verrucomicrobia bacterium]|nr:hypothetical protein [Verrucomicrobiota bacterium]